MIRKHICANNGFLMGGCRLETACQIKSYAILGLLCREDRLYSGRSGEIRKPDPFLLKRRC